MKRNQLFYMSLAPKWKHTRKAWTHSAGSFIAVDPKTNAKNVRIALQSFINYHWKIIKSWNLSISPQIVIHRKCGEWFLIHRFNWKLHWIPSDNYTLLKSTLNTFKSHCLAAWAVWRRNEERKKQDTPWLNQARTNLTLRVKTDFHPFNKYHETN